MIYDVATLFRVYFSLVFGHHAATRTETYFLLPSRLVNEMYSLQHILPPTGSHVYVYSFPTSYKYFTFEYHPRVTTP